MTSLLSSDCPDGPGVIVTELRQFTLAVVRTGDLTDPAPVLAAGGVQAELPALFIGTNPALRTGEVQH